MTRIDLFDQTQISYISQTLDRLKSEYQRAVNSKQTFVAQLRRQSIDNTLRSSAKQHTIGWVTANLSFLKDIGLR